VLSDFPNIRHLRAFSSAARLKSVNRAAREVHLSQPALTQAIAKLEAEVGAPLFVRRSTGVYPTRIGEILQRRVDRALAQLSHAAAALRRGPQDEKWAPPIERNLTATQVRALIAVADAGSYTLAARTLGVAQPSLHRAARDLERLVGRPLFERAGHGVVATRDGAELARMFKLAAHEIDQAREEMRDEHGTVAARIAVGSMPLARTYIVPRAVATLLERYPGSRVRIADASYDPLLAQLRSGAIDVMVGALRQPPPVEDVVETVLFSEPLSVVVRAGHALAAARKPSIEMLSRQSWVLPAAGTPTRQHFERIFTEKGLVPPEPAVEASSLIAVRGLLLENDMATLISRHQVRYEEAAGLLEAVKLDLGDTARPIGITTRANWVPTRLQGEFIAVLREVCRTRS